LPFERGMIHRPVSVLKAMEKTVQARGTLHARGIFNSARRCVDLYRFHCPAHNCADRPGPRSLPGGGALSTKLLQPCVKRLASTCNKLLKTFSICLSAVLPFFFATATTIGHLARPACELSN